MRRFIVIALLVLVVPLSASAAFTPTHTLSYGMSGSEVSELQQFLKDNGFFTYPTITGFFGHLTETAVMDFQKTHGIAPIGIVGPLTRASINKVSTVPAPTPPAPEPPKTPTTTPPMVMVLPPVYTDNATVSNVSGGTIVQARHHSTVATASGPFTAGAVNFNGTDAYLSNASLATPSPNGYISFSFWFYAPDSSSASSGQRFFISDPDNNGYFGAIWQAHTGSSYTWAFNSDYSTYIEGRMVTVPSIGSWHNIIGSMDMSQSPAKFVMYLDGSKVTDLDTNNTGGPIGTINIGGQPFYIGSDSPGFNLFKGYMAEVWIAPGQSLLVSGDIPQATLDKFINPSTHKPVDLGASGATPTGTAPSIYLHKSSAAAASAFASNLGTGGAFTVNGALGLAPSNPSD